jgi:sterol desaturase/sphingolipid hydroxylase (fatty acid hydroxylase superfamily)
MEYVIAFLNTLKGTAQWTWRSILFDVPWYANYFWGLILISLVIWGLEIAFPWRKNQAIFRKDFWLDGFYMFFNFFIFSIAISGFYKLAGMLFNNTGLSLKSFALLEINQLPEWLALLIFFVVLDFVQWFTHILLHKYELLWRFHKVHHSVEEMGFAAHLRYHWIENILYKPLKTIALMVLGGFEPEQAFIVHFIAITVGHLNHANIKLSWGPFKYILNNPVMHLYHHAYKLPEGKFGVNFGISLSVWDYLFKTHYIPESSGLIPLGFEDNKSFPKGFFAQIIYGFSKKRT